MNRMDLLLQEHFSERLWHCDRITRITPAIPLFVLVGALHVDYRTLEIKAGSFEDALPHLEATQALERWVLETTGTNVTEVACFEYSHWLGQTKALQVFMSTVEGRVLLGVHTEEDVPSWQVDGVASSNEDIVDYLSGLQLPSDGLLRIVNAQPDILANEDLDSAIFTPC